MRIVLDTNVLVSAILYPDSPPGQVARLVVEEALEAVADREIVAEYLEVLLRPEFRFEREEVLDLLAHLRVFSRSGGRSELRASLPDPDDAKFLECAIALRADCIVTGNKRHFPARLCRGVPVLSPAEFLAKLE